MDTFGAPGVETAMWGNGACRRAGGFLVKTVRLGKKRVFARGLLLTIVTLGVYAIYWWYKAPHEVYRQFELEDEGKDEGIVWLVLGIVLNFLLVVYFWKALGNIRYVRARMGLRPGITAGAFIALVVAPLIVINVLTIALQLYMTTVNPDAATLEDYTAEQSEIIAGLFTAIFLIALVWLVTAMVAFYRLQREINQVWDAWAERMRQLTAPPPAPPESPLPPAAGPLSPPPAQPGGLPPFPGLPGDERPQLA